MASLTKKVRFYPNLEETTSFDGTKTVPKSDKRKAQKKTEGSPKFCHEGGAWVDQLFSLNPCPVRDGPQGKNIMLGFEG